MNRYLVILILSLGFFFSSCDDDFQLLERTVADLDIRFEPDTGLKAEEIEGLTVELLQLPEDYVSDIHDQKWYEAQEWSESLIPDTLAIYYYNTPKTEYLIRLDSNEFQLKLQVGAVSYFEVEDRLSLSYTIELIEELK